MFIAEKAGNKWEIKDYKYLRVSYFCLSDKNKHFSNNSHTHKQSIFIDCVLLFVLSIVTSDRVLNNSNTAKNHDGKQINIKSTI